MRRILLWILLLGLLVSGAIMLANNTGNVQIEWLGYRITLATSLLIGVLIAALIFSMWLSALIAQIWVWPQRRHMQKIIAQQSLGIESLTHAATALALGNATDAKNALARARKQLDDAPITLLMQAQYCEKHGKSEDATALYQSLAANDATASIGMRGLLQSAERSRDYVRALSLANEASAQFPKDAALSEHAVELMLRVGDVSHAEKLLSGWKSRLRLPHATRLHLRALIELHVAQAATDNAVCITHLTRAMKLMPNHPYIPLLLIDETMKQDATAAAKLVRIIWASAPSPELTQRAITLIDMTPQAKREKLANKITRSAPEHLESWILLAHTALSIHDPASAREYAREAIAVRESRRALALMAEAETLLSDAASAHTWHTRATNAPAEEHWQCTRCGHQHAAWQLFCAQCEACDADALILPHSLRTHIEAFGA